MTDPEIAGFGPISRRTGRNRPSGANTAIEPRRTNTAQITPVPRHRVMSVWRELARQESVAMRLLLRAHGRLPDAAPLLLPELTNTQARLVLTGRRLLDALDDTIEPMTECGTAAAYRAHRRRNEQCDECRAAHAREQRDARRIQRSVASR